MTNNDPIIDMMSQQANRQLLKYAVSRQIFCPCAPCGGAVMDMRRAVLASVKTPNGEEQELIACAECWDGYRGNLEKLAAARNLTLVVLDGRELFTPKAATKIAKPKTAKPKARAAEILERAMAAVEEGDQIGICRACGNEQDGCEPDARKYACEACGANEVYGAEELIVMLG